MTSTATTFTEANTWEEVKPADQANRPPVKRYGHSAVVRDDEMWVFGGFDSDSWTCSDLWSFHFRTCDIPPPLECERVGARTALRHSHSCRCVRVSQ